MDIIFWGVRGGIPVSGNEYCEYGGDTPCVQIELDSQTLIIDSGTGIRKLGEELLLKKKKEVNLLYTHFHWDHIIGLPFFAPLYAEDFKIKLYITESFPFDLKVILNLFTSPYFPVAGKDIQEKIEVVFVGSSFEIDKLHIETIPLAHPNGGIGYKFRQEKKSFVYLTDNELGFKHSQGKEVDEYVEFAKDVSFLVHDAEFLTAEYAHTKGWGHSKLEDVLSLASKARPQTLGIFHHNQRRTDKALKEIEQELKRWGKDQGITPLVLKQGQKICL